MPCNAVSMRRATIKVDALLKTKEGIRILVNLLESTLEVKVNSSVDYLVESVEKRGYANIWTDLGSIAFYLDQDIAFSGSFTDAQEAEILAKYTKLAGKFQQRFNLELLKRIAKKKGISLGDMQTVRGNIVLKGEIAL